MFIQQLFSREIKIKNPNTMNNVSSFTAFDNLTKIKFNRIRYATLSKFLYRVIVPETQIANAL